MKKIYLILIFSFILAGVASAEKLSPREVFNEGIEQFNLGNYDKAVKLLELAVEGGLDPSLEQKAFYKILDSQIILNNVDQVKRYEKLCNIKHVHGGHFYTIEIETKKAGEKYVKVAVDELINRVGSYRDLSYGVYQVNSNRNIIKFQISDDNNLGDILKSTDGAIFKILEAKTFNGPIGFKSETVYALIDLQFSNNFDKKSFTKNLDIIGKCIIQTQSDSTYGDVYIWLTENDKKFKSINDISSFILTGLRGQEKECFIRRIELLK